MENLEKGLSIAFRTLGGTNQSASIQYVEGKKLKKNDENTHQQRYLLYGRI